MKLCVGGGLFDDFLSGRGGPSALAPTWGPMRKLRDDHLELFSKGRPGLVVGD